MSALGGPWVLGLSAAAAVVTQLVIAGGRASQVMDTYRRSIEETAKANENLRDAFIESNGLVSDQVQDIMTAKIDALRDSSQQLADQGPGLWGSFAASVRDAWDSLDGTLDGDATVAAQIAQKTSDAGAQVVEAMNKTGKSSAELGKIITGDSTAFLEYTSRLVKAGGASGQLARAMWDQRNAFLDAQQGAGQVRDAIEQIEMKAVDAAGGVDALTGSVARMRENGRTSENAQKSLTNALDGFRQAVANGGAAAVDAAGKIDLSSTAGVRLDDQMTRVAAAWDEAGAAALTAATEQNLSAEDTEAAVRAAQQQVRDQFVQTAAELLGNKEKAEALAEVFLNWPDEVKTKVTVLDHEARRKIEAFLRENSSHTLNVLVRTTMLGEAAPAGLPPTVTPKDIDGLMTGAQGKALGGPITGGVRGKDSVPILAMPGEHMLTVDDVDRLGGQEGVYRFRAALAAGQVGKYANGGEIVDSMTSVVQSRFPGMQMTSGLRYTDNGHHSTGRAADFSNGYDSTPEMRSLAAFIADNYLSQTLELIHSPFDRNIKNGAFVGDGVGFYGAGTMAAHRDHVHWAVNGPVGQPQSVVLGYGPTGTKKEWTEKDDLDLRRAELAVEKAREDLNPKQDDKRTPRDFEDDRIQLRQAEIRVEELKKEKEAALRGSTPPPPAPALTATMSDQQIERIEAGLAVSRAERERDEVYAKAGVTEDEKQQADIDLMRAQNRKSELDKPSGDIPSTWSGLFGEIAKEFVSSNVSDVLGYYGASDDLGPLVTAGMAVAKAAPDGFGADGDKPPVELPSWVQDLIGPDGQVPAQMVPDWAKAFLQSLNIKVYDNGGPLDPFGLGLNLSGQREFVLNPRETVEMEATRAMFQSFRAVMRSQLEQPAEPPQPSRDPFDSARQQTFQLPNGFDPNAVATGIRRARMQEDFETAHVR